MGNIIELILKTRSSKSLIKYNNYHKNNILGLTKVSRWELMHSNFIAWLLDDRNAIADNHSQLYDFVLMLYKVKIDIINKDARVDDTVIMKFFNSDFIVSSIVAREFNNIDIILEITTKENKILPIVIENKVESKENGKHKDQTIKYFNFCEDYYKDKNKYFDPIYIFLEPTYNKTKPKCNNYLILTYQDLVDYVIEPTMIRCTNQICKDNIRTYLQCLTYQIDNEKGDQIMAISSEEKSMLLDFLRENKDIFLASLELLDDNDFDEESKDKLKGAINNTTDKTKYDYNGKTGLGKGKLVLEVIKQYCKDKPQITYNQLKSDFPNKLVNNGKKGLVELECNVSDKEKGLNGERKRYFTDEPITLENGDVVLVNNQWKIDNIEKFINHCKNVLNIDISVSK